MAEMQKAIMSAALCVVLLTTNFAGRTGATDVKQNTAPANSSGTTSAGQTKGGLVYTNKTYGFRFALPASWKGYSIVVKSWGEGQGPLILIRHPLWTEANPRQDIPIMVFTLTQWNLVQQGKLSVSAAPVGPDKLGQNSKYVFGLPPRYNFAFPTGYEEVEEILKHDPLHAF
jgi:hypothetical protein